MSQELTPRQAALRRDYLNSLPLPTAILALLTTLAFEYEYDALGYVGVVATSSFLIPLVHVGLFASPKLLDSLADRRDEMLRRRRNRN
jgi:hypothetical protein